MEELIPLIIGIIWLLYSFYSKGQKRKQKEKSPATEKKTGANPSFLEQLFTSEENTREEFDQEIYEEEPVFEQVVESQIVSNDSDRIKPFLGAELSQFTEEGQSQFSEFQSYEEEKDSDFSSPLDLIKNIQGFDLKKAVVYSEILNAPYIDYK